MSWQTSRLVEFQHCDPAGIVFYPRYFEMINSVIEAFFREAIGYSFLPMHFRDHRGVPTVSIAVEFQTPSRLEDLLLFSLRVDRVGTSSLALALSATVENTPRMSVQTTLVRIDLKDGTPAPWPDEIRAKLQQFQRRPHG